MYENNSTTNAILVILLVLVVGFIVWFIVGRKTTVTPAGNSTPNVQVDLNGAGGTSNTGTNGTR